MPPLFLALYLEQEGDVCWRHKPLPEILVAKPRYVDYGSQIRQVPRYTKIVITGLSIELKLEYVIGILSKFGISEANEPHWAVTSDEISIIEARVPSLDDLKTLEFEDTKRAVWVNAVSAADWPHESVVTERSPMFGDRSSSDFKALGGLADFVLSPEQSKMFHAIPNRHGWGVDTSKKQQVPGKGKDNPLPKENPAGTPPPPAKAASPQPSPKKRVRAERRADRSVSVISPQKTFAARNKRQKKPNCKPTGAGTTKADTSKEVVSRTYVEIDSDDGSASSRSSLEDGEVDEESDDDPEKTDKVAEDNLGKRKMDISLGFLDFLEQEPTRLSEMMAESGVTLDGVLEDLFAKATVFQMSADRIQDQVSGTKLKELVDRYLSLGLPAPSPGEGNSQPRPQVKKYRSKGKDQTKKTTSLADAHSEGTTGGNQQTMPRYMGNGAKKSLFAGASMGPTPPPLPSSQAGMECSVKGCLSPFQQKCGICQAPLCKKHSPLHTHEENDPRGDRGIMILSSGNGEGGRRSAHV